MGDHLIVHSLRSSYLYVLQYQVTSQASPRMDLAKHAYCLILWRTRCLYHWSRVV